MTNATKDVFDNTAATYDKDRAKLLPGHEKFYGWAIALVPEDAQRILDLGAGSGILTSLVRRALPSAAIHLVDFSEAMLAKARERLGDDPRLTYAVADYMTADLGSGYDAVVSALSIHHLEDQQKRILFARIWEALRPGGIFVNAEQVAGPTATLEAEYKALWLKQVREAGATEKQVEESLYRQQEDRCASVESQLAWMREAGLVDVDCWWKEGRFAVMSGRRELD